MSPPAGYNPGVAKQTTAAAASAAGRAGHFGQFVRWHRVNAGKTADAYARDLGLTGRRLIAIEAMATPAVQHTTLSALAKSMGLSTEDLDAAWRSTVVPQTDRRAGPTTDAARRFSAACADVGIDPPEGLRRLRRWLIEQPADVQRDALSHAAPADPTRFTTAVTHRQDPVAAQAQRLAERAAAAYPPPSPPKRGGGSPAGGRRAASSARSPGPVATAGSKRR